MQKQAPVFFLFLFFSFLSLGNFLRWLVGPFFLSFLLSLIISSWDGVVHFS